jgi:hypothetical protein
MFSTCHRMPGAPVASAAGSPLGVAMQLVDKYSGRAAAQKEVVDGDVQVLAALERQNRLYKKDMQRDFKLHTALVQNELLQVICTRLCLSSAWRRALVDRGNGPSLQAQMASRADDFLEDAVTLTNAM